MAFQEVGYLCSRTLRSQVSRRASSVEREQCKVIGEINNPAYNFHAKWVVACNCIEYSNVVMATGE